MKEAAVMPKRWFPEYYRGLVLGQVARPNQLDTKCVQRVMTRLTTFSQWLLFKNNQYGV
jgi:hypothetical protein